MESETFSIVGGFQWVTPAPPGGEVFHVASTDPSYTLQWYTTGDNISQVSVDYYDTTVPQWVLIKGDIPNNNHGTDAGSENSYIWNTSSPGPLPTDLASTGLKFRVKSSVPAQPASVAATESDAIIICGDIAVTQPTDATLWTVGGTGTIEWDVYGPVDTVKITYSRDSGASYLATALTASTAADSGTQDAADQREGRNPAGPTAPRPMKIRRVGELAWLAFDALAGLEGLVHAISIRPWNMAPGSGPQRERAVANRQALCQAPVSYTHLTLPTN